VRVDPVGQSQTKTINLMVQEGPNQSLQFERDSFRDFMRSEGYDVIIQDTSYGKGL
jgi:hypothetical protein